MVSLITTGLMKIYTVWTSPSNYTMPKRSNINPSKKWLHTFLIYMAYWITSIVQSVINEPYIFDKLVLYVHVNTQFKSNTIILTGNGQGNTNITIWQYDNNTMSRSGYHIEGLAQEGCNSTFCKSHFFCIFQCIIIIIIQ